MTVGNRGMTRRQRALVGLACLAAGFSLAGCAAGDSHAKYLPDFMKEKTAGPPVAEPMPDVKALARDRRQELFAGTIDNVLVGPPHPKGTHWMFCIEPIGRGAGGQPLAPQIYLVEIEAGVIGDRLPVDGKHWCAREHLEPS